MASKKLVAAWWLCALGLVGACKSSPCDAPRDICKIEDRSCQSTILALTACQWGSDIDTLPPMRVITQQKFRDELVAQAKADGTQQTPWDGAFMQLGLLAAGQDANAASIDETVKSIAAYYDNGTKDITIIDASMSDDPLSRMYVLSHELTHYLQDRTLNLSAVSKRIERNFDSHMALSSLVEGDAIVTSTRVYAGWKHFAIGNINWEAFFSGMEDDTVMQIEASKTPLFVARQSLPYYVGGRYIERIWDEQGRDQVDALYTKPQTHSIDWYTNNAGASLARSPACAPPLAPQGLVLYGWDELGPAGLLAFFAANGGGLDAAEKDSVEQLTGDAFAVYAKTTDKAAPATPISVAWRLRFPSAEIAATVAAQIMADRAAVTVTSADNEVLITATDTPASAFSDAALASCPSFDSLGAPAKTDSMASSAVRPRELPRQ